MENKTNGLSIAGFVVSCCSMLIGLFGLVGLVGLILSAIGRSQAKNEGSKTGLATAGLIIGIVGMLYNVINMVGMFA